MHIGFFFTVLTVFGFQVAIMICSVICLRELRNVLAIFLCSWIVGMFILFLCFAYKIDYSQEQILDDMSNHINLERRAIEKYKNKMDTAIKQIERDSSLDYIYKNFFWHKERNKYIKLDHLKKGDL